MRNSKIHPWDLCYLPLSHCRGSKLCIRPSAAATNTWHFTPATSKPLPPSREGLQWGWLAGHGWQPQKGIIDIWNAEAPKAVFWHSPKNSKNRKVQSGNYCSSELLFTTTTVFIVFWIAQYFHEKGWCSEFWLPTPNFYSEWRPNTISHILARQAVSSHDPRTSTFSDVGDVWWCFDCIWLSYSKDFKRLFLGISWPHFMKCENLYLIIYLDINGITNFTI